MDERLGRRVLPVSAERVPYHRCPHCGFIFTTFCDAWTADDFRTRIYNADYGKVDYDPNIAKGVTATIAYGIGQNIAALLKGAQGKIRLLDFGAGGNPGRVGQALIDSGFDVTSYEPYFADGARAIAGLYDVIYLVEVIEHCHDPLAVAQLIARHLPEHGLLYIETMLHDHPAPDTVFDSWYIAPRNGHISIFTPHALTILFRKVGINIFQSVFGVFGFKKLPDFPNAVFV